MAIGALLSLNVRPDPLEKMVPDFKFILRIWNGVVWARFRRQFRVQKVKVLPRECGYKMRITMALWMQSIRHIGVPHILQH